MNGIAFANMVAVDLRRNVCINKEFKMKRGSNQALRKISRNCGSENTARKQLSCITSTFCDDQFIEDYATCCELEAGTFIDTPDYSFKDDETRTSTTSMIISHQQNVQFLPILLHESFPVLRTYVVSGTTVPKISKKNFENMSKLERLKLEDNQIEVIKSDTFDELVSLETIEISKMKFFFRSFNSF